MSSVAVVTDRQESKKQYLTIAAPRHRNINRPPNRSSQSSDGDTAKRTNDHWDRDDE